MFIPIQQSELVDQHGAQRPAFCVGLSLGVYLVVCREDRFELLVKVLNRDRAQFMKDTPHFHTGSGMWVSAVLGRDQDAVSTLTMLLELGRVVMQVSQHIEA